MRRLETIVVIVALLGLSATAFGVKPIQLQLSPDDIEVGVFFRSADVMVSAEVEKCDGAALVLEEGNEAVTFNRKGRKAGIWLNVAQVTIAGVPKVYLLASSKEIDDLCSPELQKQLGLGIQSLRSRMKITCNEPLIGSEADEFLKLKHQGGTYHTSIPITLTPTGGAREHLSAVIPIPATVPPGTYHALLYCFTNGEVTQQATADLTISRVGLANLLASLAHEKAATYGVLAILIAMVVGIVMGVVFHSRPGSGH